jgi:hypothetical protein
VNGRWADAEIFLHVGFRRRPAMQARVEVDKCQILTLLGGGYRVELSHTERSELTALLSGGKHAARKLKRAQILLAADVGASDDEIATNVGVGGSTVYRSKRRFVLGNLEAALSEEPRPGRIVSSLSKRRRCWSRRPVRA